MDARMTTMARSMPKTVEEKMAARAARKEMIYNVSSAASNAILVTLGMGLLMQTISKIVGWAPLSLMGTITMDLLPAAFGAAIASQMKTNTMVMFSAMAASMVGSNGIYFIQTATKGVTATGYESANAVGSAVLTTGQPISAVMAAIVAVIFGKWITGKTPLDMVLVPASTVFVGIMAGFGFAYVTTPLLVSAAQFIVTSVSSNPIIGTAIIAMVFGGLTMTPASASALAIAIGATGVTSTDVSGAIMIGTSAVFAGYPVMSYHENKIGATIAQGLVTPKIQFANILKRPILLVPPMIGAAIAAPIATQVFHLTTSFTMSGIGLNSLIVPLAMATNGGSTFAAYIATAVVIPAVISFVGYRIMAKAGWIKPQDTHLELI